MPNYVCTSLSNPNLLGQRTCQTWSEYSSTVVSNSNAAIEYSCIEFDSVTKNCLTWSIERDSVLLDQISTITQSDRWEITFAIGGFLITVWAIIQIKRMLR